MLEYEFETVSHKGMMIVELTNHQEIIRRRGAEGWRYAGWLPVKYSGDRGVLVEAQLIFERETEGNT